MVRLKCSGSIHGKHSEGSANEENFDEHSRCLEKIVFLIDLSVSVFLWLFTKSSLRLSIDVSWPYSLHVVY